MKEQRKWEDSIDSEEGAREFLDAAGLVGDEEEPVVEASSVNGKTRVTELRRRIEERLESKRLALEYEYDDIDDLPDSLQ